MKKIIYILVIAIMLSCVSKPTELPTQEINQPMIQPKGNWLLDFNLKISSLDILSYMSKDAESELPLALAINSLKCAIPSLSYSFSDNWQINSNLIFSYSNSDYADFIAEKNETDETKESIESYQLKRNKLYYKINFSPIMLNPYLFTSDLIPDKIKYDLNISNSFSFEGKIKYNNRVWNEFQIGNYFSIQPLYNETISNSSFISYKTGCQINNKLSWNFTLQETLFLIYYYNKDAIYNIYSGLPKLEESILHHQNMLKLETGLKYYVDNSLSLYFFAAGHIDPDIDYQVSNPHVNWYVETGMIISKRY